MRPCSSGFHVRTERTHLDIDSALCYIVKKRDEETAKLNEKQNALRVLQDVSEPSLTRAIEESLAAYQVSLAQRLPGGEVYDTPEFLWVTTGVPIDFYNGVFRCHLDPLRVDAQITEIMEEFRRRRLPMSWQVGPSSQPADLRHCLLAHGFRHEEDEPGMALDLLAMKEGFSAPCDGYLGHPFANQIELLLISSCFQELWH